MITVIIATHNRPIMLVNAINSVKTQTFKDYEIIVADDASTDNTEKVASRVLRSQDRYIKLDKNSGSSAKPRNEALKITKGEYVTFLDDDDWLKPKCLEILNEKMNSCGKDVGMVYCGQFNVHANGKMYKRTHYHAKGYLFKEQLGFMISSVPGTLIRKECIDKVGLFDEKNVTPHYDMWIRLSKEYEWDYVEPYLACFLNHDNSHSRKRGIWKPILGILNKHKSDFDKYPESKAAIYRTLMLHYRTDYKWREFFDSGMKSNPKHRLFDYFVMFVILINPKLAQKLTPLYRSIFNILPSWLKLQKPYMNVSEERM